MTGQPAATRPDPAQPARTIAVAARGPLSRLRLRYPDRADRPVYNAQLALELLGRTSELPASRQALIVILCEYRHAIADLVTAVSTTTPTRPA